MGGTVFLTVFAGVLVFILGQIALKFVIEPVQDQRRVIGEIAHALIFYADVGGPLSTPEEIEKARTELRGLASRLQATLRTIPVYDLLARLGHKPKREAAMVAVSNLIGWSNSFSREVDNTHWRRTIAECLDIRDVY